MSDYLYSCDKCPRTFKLEEFFEKHKKVHELKKQHRCGVCGFVYGAAKGLEGHMKTAHTEQEIAAAPAEVSKSSPEPPYDVNFHFLNRRGVLTQEEEPVKVEVDEEKKVTGSAGTGTYEVYDSVPDLSDPTLIPPNESGFFTCTICNREFTGINSLKKHIPIHTRRVQHACNTCGFIFGKKEYLLDHMRKHTGEISPVCNICTQTFNKTLKLKEHQKLHRNIGPDGLVHPVVPYRCHLCKEVFQQADVLGVHLASVHSESLHKCDLCEATFGDVRGKNHHMYNEHQLDTFKNKCVWCPACGQGFTRHYNLKVHIYKTHGEEYVENNFTPEEFASLTKPTPGAKSEDKKNSQNGHYFDQKVGTQILTCQFCNEKFLRKSDLSIHMESMHHVPLNNSSSPFNPMEPRASQKNQVYSDSDPEPPVVTIRPIKKPAPANRRPGPASRTNAPVENCVSASNIPSYIDASQFDSNQGGFKCHECGKVLQHKQSLLSHMKVIHGNHFGSNKWKGHSSVVDMIIEQSAKLSPKKRGSRGGPEANATLCSVCEQVFPNQSSLRNHVVNVHIQGQSFTCDLCGKAYRSQVDLDEHIKAKHPNLKKRLQSLRDALGIEEDEVPASKRAKLLLPEDDMEEEPEVPGPMEEQEEVVPEEEDDEDVRYEPITEAFIFENQIIYPCYVVLPYASDDDVEEAGNNSNEGLYAEDEDDLEEGQLTIDEGKIIPTDQEDEVPHIETLIKETTKDKGVSRQEAINHIPSSSPTSNNLYYAEDIKVASPEDAFPGYYPLNLRDFSLPFSLSSLLKDKYAMLPPETIHQLDMIQKMEEIKEMNAAVSEKVNSQPAKPKPKSKKVSNQQQTKTNGNKTPSPNQTKKASVTRTSTGGSTKVAEGDVPTQVTDYENQIQNDFWPLDCIKCNTLLGNLENLNLHMNDHWTDDKCCPVCGLLINSKRFNFKQHLKIHTGEKPFVCKICKRSFRQKAHMVKHVTTHRSLPNAAAIALGDD